MPKIPLYNQGLGPAVAPQVVRGTRANEGTFTAAQKGFSALGNAIEDAAFQFGKRQQEAELKKEGDEYFKDFSKKANEFSRNSIETDTTKFNSSFDAFSKKYIDDINARKDLTKSQRAALSQSLSSTALSYRFKGENQTFARGQLVRTQSAKETLATKIQQASILPSNHPDRTRLSTEIDSDIDSYALDGLRTGYSKRSVKLGFATLDLGNRIDASLDDSQFDTIEQDIKKSGLPAGGQQTLRSRIKTRKAEIKKEIYDNQIGVIAALSVDFQDKDGLQDAIMKGEAYQGVNDEGEELVVDTSKLGNGQRLALKNSVSEPLFKGLADSVQQDMVDTVTSSEEVVGMAKALYSPESLSENNKTSLEADSAVVEASQQLQQKASRLLDSEEYDATEVQSLLQQSEDLLINEISPNGVLSGRDGKLGDASASVLSKIAKARGSLVTKNESAVRVSQGVTSGESGNLLLNKDAIGLKPKELQTVINKALNDRQDDPQAQMSYLQNNGVKSEFFENLLSRTKSRLSDPNKIDIDDDDRLGISVFENMNIREDVLSNHVKKEDLTWWRSFETLRDVYGDTGALEQMRLQRSDINISVSMNRIREQVDVSVDNIVDQPWYKFDFDPPQNTGYMTQEIKNLAKEYLKMGVSESNALTRAGEQVAATHVLIGNMLIPKLEDFSPSGKLANISDINDLVIDNFVNSNKEMLEASNLDRADLGLLNITGSSSLFYVVRDGGFPVQNEDGKYMSYTKEQLINMNDEAIKTKREKALEKINEALAESATSLQRESDYLEDRDSANIQGFRQTREAVKMKIGGKQ